MSVADTNISKSKNWPVVIVNPPAVNGIAYIREGRCEQRLDSFQYCMVPISLPSIAALLRREGFDVSILDCIADQVTFGEAVGQISAARPGLTLVDVSTASLPGDLAFIRALKEAGVGHVTAIGTHVTVLDEETLLGSRLDSVIRNEPEVTALELARALASSGDLSAVDGVTFRGEGGVVVRNPDRPYIEDLDILPTPARDLLHNEKYTLPVINRPYTLLIPSRGCGYRCIYCTAPIYYGKKLRMRSVDSVLDEMEEIVARQALRDITMWSDTFTMNRDFVVRICEGIRDRGIEVNWMCNSRVDRVDLDLLRLMRSTGCIGISYGLESGVQEILDNAKKDITLDQIKDAFRWTREAGIESLAHVIFGLPGETWKTVRQTIKFVKDVDPDYAQFYAAVPFPGTEYKKMAEEKGWIVSRDWSAYELNQAVISTPALSAEDLEKARRTAYRAFYLRLNYITRRIRRLRSLREAWLNARQFLSFTQNWILSRD